MRGEERRPRSMLLVVNLEERVSREHPRRRIKPMADAALKELWPLFERMYRALGRRSIAPERLLKAALLMALYTVRGERMFCEQLACNLLFRWFLDMELDEPSFDHSSFTANRTRLLEHEVAGEFFGGVIEQARTLGLLSNEHVTVDGTLIEAWAWLKSFKRRGQKPGGAGADDPGNPTVNFDGERGANATHQSTTDPEALLARKGKGKEAQLCYWANALVENRNSLLIDLQVEPAAGLAERRWRWPMNGWRAAAASRWAATRAMIPATLLRVAVRSISLRRSPGMIRGLGVTPALPAPPIIRVTPSASGSANASRRPAAG